MNLIIRGDIWDNNYANLKSKNLVFNGIVEAFWNKLSIWKQRSLSMVGGLVLIKSVAQAFLTYAMNTFLLPKNMLA